MRHVSIIERGTHLGVSNDMLVLREKDSLVREWPLNRLRTITLSSSGISISTNLIAELARYGIALYVIDFRGRPVAQIAGSHQHAVAEVRRRQILYLERKDRADLAARFVYGKIRNQRAVLLYYAKVWKAESKILGDSLEATAERLMQAAHSIRYKNWMEQSNWQEELLGIEGNAAREYWGAVRDHRMLGENFTSRTGRGAEDVPNQALNLGYSILISYVWSAIAQAGLEPFMGVFHSERPGKPSLVLDLMEEYRPWTVDRVLMRMRKTIEGYKTLAPGLRKEIISRVHEAWNKRYPYYKKRVLLTAILQRQVYRLGGEFFSEKKYSPYLFKW